MVLLPISKDYMNEEGIVFVLTRGNLTRFGGGQLIDLVMENKVVDANIEGIEDEFFVVVPDKQNEGFYLPYMYVILKKGYTVEDIRESILSVLETFEYPVEIIQLKERPFFHFKTNRIGLKRELLATGN